MALTDVYSKQGEKVSEIELSDDVFSVEIKPWILHEVVVAQLAARRRGTSSVKNRSDVNATGKKQMKQKGSGRARRGERSSPIMRGGGSVFGPHPRDYSYTVPKKVRRQALAMALSSKLVDQTLKVIDSLSLERIKTRDVAAICSALALKKALLVVNGKDENLELSARNLPNVKVLRVEGLNVYDILRYDHLILDAAAIDGIRGRFEA
ncbi:MAG: 50S ribosomal protein L4 [Deltaproteobacteria bacterium]|nr:50S ribosomal protein L4 [Deltaproteobacteria bacterium]